MPDDTNEPASRHFIEQIIDADIASGKWGQPGDRSVVATRFPPEPNGYLHIGHAKAVNLSYGLAAQFGGRFMLRFDDTNPAKEEQEYVDSIIEDVRWLGAKWAGEVRFASDYFEQFYEWAQDLIKKGLAYVDEQSPEQMKQNRGDVTKPGVNSPFRDRPAEESLDLFAKMKAGAFKDGSMVLRAKIDMASPNMNLRDPVMYRVVNAKHHRTGSTWHIYPMYDWAHGLEDSIEGITHSICTLEFENHRPLYDWFIDAINKGRSEPIHHPQQIEFSRLEPTYIITSKRNLKLLVDDGHVMGWDDPRMPTVSGMRRRGFTPESLRAFAKATGVTKFKGAHDIGLLEAAVRDHLNIAAPRRMAVLDPVKVVITNWGEHGDSDRIEEFDAINNPNDEAAGTRKVAFSCELYIEREDFMEDPPKKFFRLGPGREVRLRYAYWVTCTDFVKDSGGNVTEIHCTYDPATKGGENPPPDADGNVRKVKGTIHWVSAHDAIDAEVRQIDRLFTVPHPAREPKDAPEGWSFMQNLNPDAMTVIGGAKVEPALASTEGEPTWPDGIRRFQFERMGYFCVDRDSAKEGRLIFNRTATLRDSWSKEQGK
ncbi:MAG: glutamine--tRNA ligase/YqeY domain fusion protein [Phycisphaerales bacterium]|nr:glutamine--tRNA ligase/YqeY domain fusion protein [Phycisphaerales bacterium]MCB9835154.1 glutamine--tRNA ligase/YqeY domain fusion protein [Phycisphaera sp.]